jgi:hypothetical protein
MRMRREVRHRRRGSSPAIAQRLYGVRTRWRVACTESPLHASRSHTRHPHAPHHRRTHENGAGRSPRRLVPDAAARLVNVTRSDTAEMRYVTVATVLLVLAGCSPNPGRPGAGESTSDTGSADSQPNVDAMVRNTYTVAHDVCGDDPDRVHKEAESRSVHDAAEWYSKGSREGAHRAASYRGCADALLVQFHATCFASGSSRSHP